MHDSVRRHLVLHWRFCGYNLTGFSSECRPEYGGSTAVSARPVAERYGRCGYCEY